MLQAALFGGLFIGILSALPFVGLGNCCCCLWIVSGGALAGYLDQQNDARPTTIGRGAKAGLAAGIVGAIVWVAANALLEPVLAPVRERLIGGILRMARDMPPEVRASLESIRSSSSRASAFGFLILLCTSAVFSTVGGMVGAAFFRNDVPPALGGHIEPPQ